MSEVPRTSILTGRLRINHTGRDVSKRFRTIQIRIDHTGRDVSNRFRTIKIRVLPFRGKRFKGQQSKEDHEAGEENPLTDFQTEHFYKIQAALNG